MRFWRSIGLAALAIASLTAPAGAQQQPATPEKVAAPKAAATSASPERRAWMMGFSYGYGGTRLVTYGLPVTAEIRSDTGVEYPPLVSGVPDWSGTDIETSGTVQFRFGYAINSHWMVGFERSGWVKDFDDYKWTFRQSIVSATHYFGGGGFFARGGAGITSLDEKVPARTDGPVIASLAANATFDPPFFVLFEDHGFALEGALGYERRLYKRVSIVPEISIRSMTYGHSIRSQIGAASLGFNWWY